MASSPSSYKPLTEAGLYEHGQDSAVDLQDVAESSTTQSQLPPTSQVVQDLENDGTEAEEDGDTDFESDSAFDSGSLLGDETDTLASSILNHRIENESCRSYHAYRDGAYWGPNDELAKEILDFAHHMYLLTLDQQLYLAPIRSPQNILDVGTGTGIWAIDMADQFPSATVTGTDLSPIQPEWVPPNCHFEIDDVTLEWTFPSNHFDFIHIRELFGCIPDWDFFFQQAYKHTKPGGWVEIVEHSVQPVSDDETMGPDHFYHTWGKVVIEMGQKFGKSFTIWEENAERMRNAGFVDVVEVHYKWPMNGWPKDEKLKNIGRWNQLRLMDGVEGFMLRLLTQVGGWSVARAQVHLAQMRKELKSYGTHAYLPGTVVYGRKPLTA
ncbi:hypothetical protein HBI52_000930 [Parastagonospora nodorum]|nr:hypothetical protein HBH43_114390 [Parastagonospora nodorum]KAH5083112.1 hypothetical protein HBH95_050260 [Parastagonospora nodorum]KAH5532556.1 hypothetical protein HBI52_000930 [Parastagonospora nodorum]KAH5768953.1 hypothetical protein HBI17_020590 [Parastagonospora nodorum]KAH6214415.1 hypothetical protein HBI43_137090 [Parastagonospora nodorum]